MKCELDGGTPAPNPGGVGGGAPPGVTAGEAGPDPRQVLGVAADAGEQEIRAAYLRRVKEHPPDRSPEEFERIRDAYHFLRDPRRRCELRFIADDPEAPLVALLEEQGPARPFLGPEPWLAALRER